VPHESGRVPLVTQENIDLVKRAMVGVTTNPSGTAYQVFRDAAYVAGGKTGTAQVFSLQGQKYHGGAIAEHLRDHSLFIAFAPADHPQIAVALIVENGGWGASVAGPIARRVLDYYLLQRNKPGVLAQEVAAAMASASGTQAAGILPSSGTSPAAAASASAAAVTAASNAASVIGSGTGAISAPGTAPGTTRDTPPGETQLGAAPTVKIAPGFKPLPPPVLPASAPDAASGAQAAVMASGLMPATAAQPGTSALAPLAASTADATAKDASPRIERAMAELPAPAVGATASTAAITNERRSPWPSKRGWPGQKHNGQSAGKSANQSGPKQAAESTEKSSTASATSRGGDRSRSATDAAGAHPAPVATDD
jgi:penicillin-binding protein 2